jgi:hypothetical protein
MDKIIRIRNTQPLTLDEFIDEVLDKPNCNYCMYKEDCVELMGEDLMGIVGNNGCSAFDFTLNDLKNKYIKKYSQIGT